MRIHVVQTAEKRWSFVAEPRTAPASSPPEVEPSSWLWVKLARTYEQIRASLDQASSSTGRSLRRVLTQLEAHIPPEEMLLKQMRKAPAIDILYPTTLKEPVVRRRFLRFLRRRVHYHTRWLIINFLLLPLTGLMMVLPGPNVFFGWNAYRVISHHLARQGGCRVLRGEVPLSFIPLPEETSVGSSTSEPLSTVA
jgi:hypothetical protein